MKMINIEEELLNLVVANKKIIIMKIIMKRKDNN